MQINTNIRNMTRCSTHFVKQLEDVRIQTRKCQRTCASINSISFSMETKTLGDIVMLVSACKSRALAKKTWKARVYRTKHGCNHNTTGKMFYIQDATGGERRLGNHLDALQLNQLISLGCLRLGYTRSLCDASSKD